MGAANKIQSGVFDHLYVAEKSGVRHPVTPPRVILMNIRAVKVVV